MKQFLKKCVRPLAVATAFAMVFTLVVPLVMGSSSAVASAESKCNGHECFSKVKVDSKYAVIMDADTGQVLFDKAAGHKMYPASTSKVMTAIVAIENSELSDMLTVSENALKGQLDNGAHIGLKAGEKISMKDALCALWIESANDSAITIAENVGGSEAGFAKMLNAKAKELNLEGSHFITPNGLYDKGHYTTAKDLATITCYALKNPDFRTLIETYIHELPPTNKRQKAVTIYTNHPMAPYKYHAYPHIVGGKTGYVPESKCNMITVASKNNLNLICVTGRTNSLYTAAADAKELLDAGFKGYKKDVVTRDCNNMTLDKILESGNYATRHSHVRDNAISVVVPKDADLGKVRFKMVERELMFPIVKGTEIGTVEAYYNGVLVGSSPILAEKDMSFFLYAVYTSFKFVLYAIPVLLILLLLLLIRKKQAKKKVRRAKGQRPYDAHGPAKDMTRKSEVSRSTTKGNRTTSK